MSIRVRTFLGLALATLALVVAIYGVLMMTVGAYFERLEHDSVTVDLDRAYQAIETELGRLHSTTGDWAEWDDTYQFVLDRNPAYVEANLFERCFQNLQLDVISFVDAAGATVWARRTGKDEPERTVELQPQTRAFFERHVRLGAADAAEKRCGIVLSADGPMLLCARKILPSGGKQAEPRGTVIMAILLDERRVNHLAEITRLDLAIAQRAEVETRPAMKAAWDSLAQRAGTVVTPLDEQCIGGYRIIPDVSGTPALLLQVRLARSIYAGGARALRLMALILLAMAIVFCAAISVLVERLVLSKLAHKERLRESDERYRLLAENTTDMISRHDSQQRFVYASPAARRILGYDPVELLGRTLVDICHAKDVVACREALRAAAGAVTCRVRHKDGRFIWIETNFRPVLAAERNEIIAVSRDVTQRKALEQQFFHAQKMEVVGRLAAGLTHDFNNLLTVISSDAELLKLRCPDDAEINRMCDEIVSSAFKGATLIRRLLAFSRHQLLRPELVRIDALLGEMRSMLARLAGEKVAIHTDLKQDLFAVRADRSQLEQALMNLTANARDAMPEGGTLTLRAENVSARSDDPLRIPELRTGEYILLAVADTGTGLSAEAQQHLFEPFFTTKPVGRGTGLGLATVQGIVVQCGGHVEARNLPGGGAEFRLYFPRATDSGQPAEIVAAPRSEHKGGETILLVDDDDELRHALAGHLRLCGYVVRETGQPQEALRLAQSQPIDLLISDVMLPQMNGVQLHDRLTQFLPALPVLFISGYSELDLLQPGLRYLEKPFSVAELLRYVRQTIQLKHSSPVLSHCGDSLPEARAGEQ